MNGSIALAAMPALRMAPHAEPPLFAVPARRNPRLQLLADRIRADEELRQLWRCANVTAMDRLGLSDHGEVHVRIVANAALRLLRLLREAGLMPGVMAHHHLPGEEAEVVVVLAAALHDLGMSIHRDGQPALGLVLAHQKARELLESLYPPRERTILISEVTQAILTHQRGSACLTLEAGVLHLADGMDIAEGRVSAAAPRVEAVNIKKGLRCPVRLEVCLDGPDGMRQVGRLLQGRLKTSGLTGFVEMVARFDQGAEQPLLDFEPDFTEP